MTLPANIRVNVGAPFPSVVKAQGPLAIQRKNGIWTVNLLPPTQYVVVDPPASALPTTYVYAFDSVAGVWEAVSLSTLASGGTQRAVTTTPVSIVPTDFILHLNLTTSTNIVLPSYAARGGLPLLFKDVGMQATAHPLTISPAAGETIDGLPAIPLNVNGQAIRVVPANDGVNTGWFTE